MELYDCTNIDILNLNQTATLFADSYLVIPAFGQSAEQGALPQLYAAAAPEVNGGDYFGPGGWQEFRGSPKLIRARDHAYDEDAARRLWQVSAQLTGETFPPLES